MRQDKHMRETYLNPLTDFGFKRIFGSELNKDLLISFLNELLPSRHQIVNLTYLKNEQLGVVEGKRRAIFDIYCQNEQGEYFIVEMQRAKQEFFKDRNLYYTTFPIQSQGLTGEWNYELKAVYSIVIMDFIFEQHKDSAQVKQEVMLKNMDNEVFYDKLTFIYLELPKFKKRLEELDSNFDKWLYVLRYLSKLQHRPVELQERIFDSLFKVAKVAQLSEEEYFAYIASYKDEQSRNNSIKTSWKEGHKQGIEEGREQGIEEERKQSRLKMQQSIQRMKSKGITREMIAEITGWSLDDIDAV